MKRDDSSLTNPQYARVRKEARRLLSEAGALGCFPTPVEEIMAAAQIEEIPDPVLSKGFLSRLRKRAGDALKKALTKVVGLFDAHARFVYIDQTLHAVKQTFVRLHETGHGFLPWQREIYAVVEDCEKTLDPDVADQFEREASVFAAEVLFQLDAFTKQAEEMPFSIRTPLNVGRKYGASAYASVRRYVAQNWRACAVLVLDQPELVAGDGFKASIRRFVPSPKFRVLFGDLDWPDHVTPDDQFGKMVPMPPRRMSGKREISIRDRNGTVNVCIAEAFNSTYQIFILIHAARTLTATSVIVPKSA